MMTGKHRCYWIATMTLKGDLMKNLMMNWLHDLAVALGLIPPMQPVPIPADEEKRRRQPRR
ncbi:hypothetical protein PSEMO_34640 [Pseudomonas putida]|uniref:Uncharacterized protein n=1 Tax=Pseudomonas putida TaxID=303 RepID=A0A1Q9R2P2_PSEPU|nr:hypothetical protein PSEMO_34640 [Pseudomonas putida]